jgi:hypothetical protein
MVLAMGRGALQERPDAILPTMGGQTGLNLAKALSEVGLHCGAFFGSALHRVVV